ncbi:transcriptional regulator [Lentzea guizhouensis]|uniref:Transcriptional regulator n=1 Tax=Lentzea guizhouensis TaxID=1586287 RepID=A0A1B2HP81_9PSEU|nr:helix-turn-helix domain-containing protein [Lentzea guizhouensis]ANZ39528.1 transcriptional regulator [Lentzea guizhouensis]
MILSNETVLGVELSPLRRSLLELLKSPASATQLAAALQLPRQRVNYHVRALEQAGLVELVEQRQRRGCVERVLRARPGREIAADVQDQFAATHLVSVAQDTAREVERMSGAAADTGKRLLTFTVETTVRFGEPGAVHEFTSDLAEAVRQLALRYDTESGRPYRVVALGHPGGSDER